MINPFIHTRKWIVSADIMVNGTAEEIERIVEADTLFDALLEAEEAVMDAISDKCDEGGEIPFGFYDIWDICMAEEDDECLEENL